MKLGFSKDIHKLVKNGNKDLILGGFTIKDSKYTIKAHSDGDIILHSICSSLLSCLNLKTLGEYFPDNQKINKNRSSIDFLDFCLDKLNESQKKIISMDICIICEKIILKDYLSLIKKNLMNLLNIKDDSIIGIKATRFENKRSKYIECYCNLLID